MARDKPAIGREMPIPPGRALGTWVIIALLVAGLVSLYQHTSRKYPYYFIWDMDLSTAVDTALINSGRTPDHINHTAFGMYLVLKYATLSGERLGLLSTADLDGVFGSLNPSACMAELTDYLRRVSPWVALGAVLCLWGAACLMFRLGPVACVVALVLCASQESMLYHCSVVRTGLYSLFFWCAGLLALALATRRRREPSRLAWLFAGGVLLGLAYMTKLQAMIYVAIGAMVFFFGVGRQEDQVSLRKKADKPADAPTPRWGMATFILSMVNLVMFLLLLAVARAEDIPAGKALFTAKFGMTKHATLLLVLCAALSVVQGWLWFRKKTGSRWFALSARVTVLLSGGLAAFALHLLMFSDVSLSLRYLLWDFKILFLRPLYTGFRGESFYEAKDLSFYEGLTFYLSRFWRTVCYHPLLFLAHVASLGLVGLAAFLRKRRELWRKFRLYAILSGMVLLNVVVGVRFHQKDMIWYEPALIFLTIGYLATAFSQEFARRAVRASACLAVLGVLLIVNLIHLSRVVSRIDSNLHKYGWHAERWLRNVYAHNHREYARRMYQHYAGRAKVTGPGLNAALRQAAHHAEAGRIASFVFRNQAVGMPHIGVVWEGLPVWRKEPGYRIVELPASLRDAMVVDASSAPMGRRGFLPEDMPARFGGGPDDHAPAESDPSMAILPRPDLRVFLFLEERDYAALAGPPGTAPKQAPATPLRIKVARGSSLLTLRGLHLPEYRVIRASKIKGRYFFVIHPPFGR